jgi:hypothetical protein
MKAITGGKRYDTETARHIANWKNGLGTGDFKNVNEDLYRTKSGSFFLAGEGDAMTKYSEGNGNTTWGSSKIIPLADEAALDLAGTTRGPRDYRG